MPLQSVRDEDKWEEQIIDGECVQRFKRLFDEIALKWATTRPGALIKASREGWLHTGHFLFYQSSINANDLELRQVFFPTLSPLSLSLLILSQCTSQESLPSCHYRSIVSYRESLLSFLAATPPLLVRHRWSNETRLKAAQKLHGGMHSPIHRLLFPFGATRPFLPLLFLFPCAKASAPFPPLARRIALRTFSTPSPPLVPSFRDFFAVGPSRRSSVAAIARAAFLSSSAERSLGSN